MERERERHTHEEHVTRRREGRHPSDERPAEAGATQPRPRRPPEAGEVDWPAEESSPTAERVHYHETVVERPATLPPREEEVVVVRRRPVVDRVIMAVDYLFVLLYGLLGFRFLLSLMGASESSGFVQLVLGLTAPFYAPFHNIVGRPALEGGFVDYPVLIALMAYGLLHIAARGLVRVIAGQRRTP